MTAEDKQEALLEEKSSLLNETTDEEEPEEIEMTNQKAVNNNTEVHPKKGNIDLLDLEVQVKK